MKIEVFDDLVHFLAEELPLSERLSFRPTPSAQQRLNTLAQICIAGHLTPEERSEIEVKIQLERLMQLARARRASTERNFSSPSPGRPFSILSNSKNRPHRCEYCLMHSEDVYFEMTEHDVIAAQHGGHSGAENKAYMCVECHLRKGSDVASLTSNGQRIPLFHPRCQRWGAHFRAENGLIEPLTRIGEVTTRQLDLNDETRVQIRQTLAEQRLYPRR